jgi:hypothetical protein
MSFGAKTGTEHIAPLTQLAPDSYAAGTHTGTAIARNRARAALAHISVGEIQSGGSLVATLQKEVAGVWSNVVGADGNPVVSTTINAAASDDLYLDVPLSELEGDNFRLSCVVATAAVEFAVIWNLLDFPAYPHGVTGVTNDATTLGVGGRADQKDA